MIPLQICNINMVLGPPNNSTVSLIPSRINMEQELDMAIFHISNWNLGFKTNGKEGLEMSITMRRKIIGELMTTYFPSILLIAITFATTFFKPFFFEAALSVNLTTMLVMTTIFISKMEGLPPTSDIKMIDIWLILCQMVPFTQVVLLTAMQCLRKDGLEEGVIEDETKVKLEKNGVKEDTEVTVFEEDQEVSTKEAWEAPKKNMSYMTILMVIGEFININDTEAYFIIPQEGECCQCQRF